MSTGYPVRSLNTDLTIGGLLVALQGAAARLPVGLSTPVYLDTGDERVSSVEVEPRTDEDGSYLALAPGETLWS
jgi:hypothetical protein